MARRPIKDYADSFAAYLPSDELFAAKNKADLVVADNVNIGSGDYSRMIFNLPHGVDHETAAISISDGVGVQRLSDTNRANLFNYSEHLNNATWAKSEVTVADNAVSAPNGSLTADKIRETSATAQHYIARNYTVTAGIAYTFSVYAKAGERSWIKLRLGGTAFGGEYQVNFNLLTGAYVVTTALVPTVTVVGLSGGYWRIAITATAAASALTTVTAYMLSPSDNITINYAGDGVSGLYLWGGQFEESSAMGYYIPSNDTFTGRTSTGTYFNSAGQIATAASGVARYSYNPLNLSAPPELLLEAASNNQLLYSGDLSNAAWSKTIAWGFAAVQPLFIGGSSWRVTNDGGGARSISQSSSAFTGAADTNWFVLERIEGVDTATTTDVELYDTTTAQFVVRASLNWSTGAASLAAGAGTVYGRKLSDAGPNGGRVYLIGVSGVGTSGNGRRAYLYPTGTGTNTHSIIVHHAQLEAGITAPTSYIHTTTAAATRAADTSTSEAGSRTDYSISGRTAFLNFAPSAGESVLFSGQYNALSNLRALIYGMAGEIARVDESLYAFRDDVNPSETLYFLDEWESVVGIPDSCFLGNGSINERRRDILLKLAALGVQTVEEFTELASILGLSVTVKPAAPHAIFPMEFPILLVSSAKEARFTILVEHTQESTATFPLVFPVTFGDPALQKLECVLSKLKPANCALIFRQVT